MSDASRTRMIEMYMEEATAPMFLSSFCRTPAENFHDSEFVEIDIERDSEDVAVAITDLTAGPNINEANQYTNKKFKPPVFREAGAVSAYSQHDRQPGENPFDDPDFGANATRESFKIFRKNERKIRRAVEHMMSQVLQEGVVTLRDENGNAVYVLDYQQKDNHRAVAPVAWAADGSAGNPIQDISNLGDTIRRNGKRKPDTLIFGGTAFERFLINDNVKEALENRRMDRGSVERPSREREDAKFHGTIAIDNRVYEIWLYDGFYKDPQTDELTDYVAPDNLIMLSSGARIDLSYGSIPLFRPEARALSFLPDRLTGVEQALAMTLNSWIKEDNSALMVEAGTRPLVIPTAIDTFGSLNTAGA